MPRVARPTSRPAAQDKSPGASSFGGWREQQAGSVSLSTAGAARTQRRACTPPQPPLACARPHPLRGTALPQPPCCREQELRDERARLRQAGLPVPAELQEDVGGSFDDGDPFTTNLWAAVLGCAACHPGGLGALLWRRGWAQLVCCVAGAEGEGGRGRSAANLGLALWLPGLSGLT
jgi:hypothetical protein